MSDTRLVLTTGEPVDHGTTSDPAGTGRADAGSLQQAIFTAVAMVDPFLSSQS